MPKNIYYKATYNFKCRDQTYQVGKTYTSDQLKICNSGMHFCKQMICVLDYYKYNKDFVLLEVEILGKIVSEGTKHATNKLKVLREIPFSEYSLKFKHLVFDAFRNIIRIKNKYNGGQKVFIYDNYGNLIKSWLETKEGKKKLHLCEYTYDSRGNILTKQSSDAGTTTYTYDECGNMLSEEINGRICRELTYDTRGNILSIKTAGNLDIYTYDLKGNKVTEDHYDQKNNLTQHSELSYDKFGNLTRKKYIISSGYTQVSEYTYDSFRNKLTSVHTHGKSKHTIQLPKKCIITESDK